MATGDKKYVIMQTDRGKADSYGFAPQTQIADVEASTTAAQAYAIGDYFVLNGYFYRATAAISVGDTISPGSGSGNNCVATNIAAELVARQVEITNTTPTNLTGILKGNGSTVGVATAGTDYAAPAAVTATQQDIAYVLGDPAGVNVASGQYAIYNNALYKATAAISSSEAASSFTSKLTAVTGGIGNELKSAMPIVEDVSSKFTLVSGLPTDFIFKAKRYGDVVTVMTWAGHLNVGANSSTKIATYSADIKPLGVDNTEYTGVNIVGQQAGLRLTGSGLYVQNSSTSAAMYIQGIITYMIE